MKVSDRKNLMKKRIISTLSLAAIITTLKAEPNGRGWDPNMPDLGLPGGHEVLYGLLIAVITVPIGYAIINIKKKDNSKDEGLFPGCLGLILIGGGIVCLIPLFVWICSILSYIYLIGVALFIVIIIISFIVSRFK